VAVAVAPATPSAWADRNEMEQAISRILYNALEHSGEERVSVQVRPEGEDREEILVSIGAPGMELREDEMLPLFGPAAAMVTERASSGNCLGLAVARALIEMHGGRVWVDDGDGAGAAINFTVPAATRRREQSLPEVIVGVGGPSEERAEADGEGNSVDSRRRPVGSQADARQPDPVGG
jgi:signal transduction histidine kinase